MVQGSLLGQYWGWFPGSRGFNLHDFITALLPLAWRESSDWGWRGGGLKEPGYPPLLLLHFLPLFKVLFI